MRRMPVAVTLLLRWRAAALVGVLACLLTPSVASAAAGDLDLAFDDDGYALYPVDDLDGFTDAAAAAVPQPGGRTLLVGSAYGPDTGQGRNLQVTFVQLGADGKLDPAYGDNGVVWLPLSAGNQAVDAVALPDGDIAVLADGLRDGESGAYGLSRANPDGTLDQSFGTSGTAIAGYMDFQPYDCPSGPNGSCGAAPQALELYGSEHLIVAASVSADGDAYDSSPPTFHAGVARYDLAGQLDPSFGDGDGTTTLATPTGYRSFGSIEDIAVEPTGGKLLLAEQIHETNWMGRTALHRLEEDGVPDATFGADGDGIALVRFRPDVADQENLSEYPAALTALPDGDIALAGSSSRYVSSGPDESHGVVARLSSFGELVDGFGTGGVALADRGYAGDHAFQELELVDGVLYAGGIDRRYDSDTSSYGTSQSWLARLDDQGFDTAFGQEGSVVGGQMSTMTDLAGAADGFAVVAGSYASYSGTEWAAARFDIQDSRQPVNVAPPEVEGPYGDSTVATGETATAKDGSWHYGADITRQWQRCSEHRSSEVPPAGGCTDISSATGTTYVVQDVDKGKYLRVVVTNTSGEYSAAAGSTTVDVPDPSTPPEFTSGPTVDPSGSVPAGSRLRATWSATGTEPITAEVRWFHCPTATTGPCHPVPADEIKDDSYTTSSADVGKFLRAIVELTGPKGGYTSKETANATGVGAATTAAAPKATTAPTITPAGSVVEGTTLQRASDGAWDQGDLTYSYRWERCDGGCAAISGAGGASYVTTAADAGKSIRLVVDARHGDGPIGSAASEATAVTAKPAPKEEPVRPKPEVKPRNPFGLTGPVVYQDTTTTKAMPDVRGMQVDAAKQKIEAAGIHANVDVKETIRKKPLKLPGKSRLDIGDVSGQSLSAGTRVTSSIGQRKAIRLVTEAGPKATKGNGGPSGSVCTGKSARDDLKRLGLGEVLDLLKAKRCTRVEVDFKVSAGAREVEVRRATKDGRDLELQVTVPKNPAYLDLTAVFRQGAFNGRPSFGRQDWALTADAMNILGVQVLNREGKTVDEAEIFLDASKVGTDDIDGEARGGVFVRGFKPTKSGVANVLVVQRDSAGNRIFGFGYFEVLSRRRAFTAIDGRRYTANGSLAGAGAHAAGIGELFAAIGRLAQDLGAGVARLFAGSVTEQTISTAAKQNVGMAQLSLGDILSGKAGVVAAGGANVVAAGGANVVAAGGANVVAAGGGNAISLAAGNVVAAGGGNVLGHESILNGTGSLISLPAEVVAAGGGNVVAAGGGNVIAPGGANVVAAGGANAVAAGGLN